MLKAQNNFIFKNLKPDPANTVDSAIAASRIFCSWGLQNTKSTCGLNGFSQTWTPPQIGTLKLNIDGSYSQGEEEGAVACVCRDHRGRLLNGHAYAVQVLSPLQVEVQALFQALGFLMQRKKENQVRQSHGGKSYIPSKLHSTGDSCTSL
ncbi:Dof-type domain-containing protein [Psidium guajava]|nr:Dof-type domain-containing protein [Psidium guajava]